MGQDTANASNSEECGTLFTPPIYLHEIVHL